MQLHVHPWTGGLEVVCFLSVLLSVHVPTVNNELSFCSIPFHHPRYSIFSFALLPQSFPWSYTISHLSLFFPLYCMWCINKSVMYSRLKLGSALSSHLLCRRTKVIFNCESEENKMRCWFVRLCCQARPFMSVFIFSSKRQKHKKLSKMQTRTQPWKMCNVCAHRKLLFQNTRCFHLRSSLSLQTQWGLRSLRLKQNFHIKSWVWL